MVRWFKSSLANNQHQLLGIVGAPVAPTILVDRSRPAAMNTCAGCAKAADRDRRAVVYQRYEPDIPLSSFSESSIRSLIGNTSLINHLAN